MIRAAYRSPRVGSRGDRRRRRRRGPDLHLSAIAAGLARADVFGQARRRLARGWSALTFRC